MNWKEEWQCLEDALHQWYISNLLECEMIRVELVILQIVPRVVCRVEELETRRKNTQVERKDR